MGLLKENKKSVAYLLFALVYFILVHVLPIYLAKENVDLSSTDLLIETIYVLLSLFMFALPVFIYFVEERIKDKGMELFLSKKIKKFTYIGIFIIILVTLAYYGYDLCRSPMAVGLFKHRPALCLHHISFIALGLPLHCWIFWKITRVFSSFHWYWVENVSKIETFSAFFKAQPKIHTIIDSSILLFRVHFYYLAIFIMAQIFTYGYLRDIDFIMPGLVYILAVIFALSLIIWTIGEFADTGIQSIFGTLLANSENYSEDLEIITKLRNKDNPLYLASVKRVIVMDTVFLGSIQVVIGLVNFLL